MASSCLIKHEKGAKPRSRSVSMSKTTGQVGDIKSASTPRERGWLSAKQLSTSLTSTVPSRAFALKVEKSDVRSQTVQEVGSPLSEDFHGSRRRGRGASVPVRVCVCARVLAYGRVSECAHACDWAFACASARACARTPACARPCACAGGRRRVRAPAQARTSACARAPNLAQPHAIAHVSVCVLVCACACVCVCARVCMVARAREGLKVGACVRVCARVRFGPRARATLRVHVRVCAGASARGARARERRRRAPARLRREVLMSDEKTLVARPAYVMPHVKLFCTARAVAPMYPWTSTWAARGDDEIPIGALLPLPKNLTAPGCCRAPLAGHPGRYGCVRRGNPPGEALIPFWAGTLRACSKSMRVLGGGTQCQLTTCTVCIFITEIIGRLRRWLNGGR